MRGGRSVLMIGAAAIKLQFHTTLSIKLVPPLHDIISITQFILEMAPNREGGTRHLANAGKPVDNANDRVRWPIERLAKRPCSADQVVMARIRLDAVQVQQMRGIQCRAVRCETST